MDIILEVETVDSLTITEIENSGLEIKEKYPVNSLTGAEVLAFVIALIPSAKDIIVSLVSKPTVTVKLSFGDSSIEVTARSREEAEKIIEKYVNTLSLKDNNSKENDANGKQGISKG